MVPRIARVARRVRELPDTWTLDLVSPDGGPLMHYAPGQFTMMYVFGVGEIPVSISGDASDATRLVQTVRAVGKVSEAVTRLAAATRSDCAARMAPPGRWRMAMAVTWSWLPAGWAWRRCGRRCTSYRRSAGGSASWCCCTARAGRRTSCSAGSSRAGGGSSTWRSRSRWITPAADWRGHVGVVTKLIPRLGIDAENAMALVCGPEVMMRFAASALNDIGMPEETIHLSLERNMKCAVGLCGHCQFAGSFICKDGAVMRYDNVRRLLGLKEI